MRSVITSAVLATAAFGQAFGTKVGHRHQHIHDRRAANAAEKRDMVTATINGQVETWENNYFGPGVAAATSAAAAVVDSVASVASSAVAEATSAAAAVVASSSASSTASSASASATASSSSSSSGLISSSKLTSVASALLSKLKVLTGTNTVYDSSCAIGLGTNGTFQLNFQNSADEDIVLVVWSSYDDAVTWDAMTVQVTHPNITVAIASGGTTSVSFNPANHNQGTISGAFSAIYSDTTISEAGIIANTWGEFTFTASDVYSTTDVTRLVYPSGHGLSIQNYKSSATNGEYVQGATTCLSNMSDCVFVCTDSASPCAYTLQNCPVGEAGNTASADGQNGGCAFEGASGIADVVFSA